MDELQKRVNPPSSPALLFFAFVVAVLVPPAGMVWGVVEVVRQRQPRGAWVAITLVGTLITVFLVSLGAGN